MDNNQNTIEIPGTPIPAARPRFTRFGKAYDAKTQQKATAKKIVVNQWQMDPLKEPLSIDLCYSMPIPKSTSKKKREQLIGMPHVIKPDCDNLAKFTLDVLNGVVYQDDSCVYDLHITKVYSKEARTVIKVRKQDDR